MLFLARFFSLVSNPLIVSFPVPFLAAYKETHNSLYAFWWTLLSSIFLLAIPLFIFLGKRRGIFSDLELSKRAERPIFFLFLSIVGILYLTTIILFHGPRILLLLFISGVLGLILFFLVNIRIKASLHVFVVSVITIIFGLIYGDRGLVALSFVPLVAWARIKTKQHTFSETIVGLALGVIVAIFTFNIRRYF